MRAPVRAEVWAEVRAQMCPEVQPEVQPEVRPAPMTFAAPRAVAPDRCAAAAGLRLLHTYAGLAARGEHLLGRLLAGQVPRQWAHYPADDAIDLVSGYQWFYHSHSPEDRPGAAEHGHVHLFARRSLWGRRLRSRAARRFAALCGHPCAAPATRHLLAIGFDAKGLPISLFTVNSWVTGDLMLGADLTLELLASMALDTGHPEVDAVIESVVRLCAPELRELMQARDDALRAHPGAAPLADEALEQLSVKRIDLDARLSALAVARTSN